MVNIELMGVWVFHHQESSGVDVDAFPLHHIAIMFFIIFFELLNCKSLPSSHQGPLAPLVWQTELSRVRVFMKW